MQIASPRLASLALSARGATLGKLVGDRLKFPTASFSYASLIGSQIAHTVPAAGDISDFVFTDAHWFLNTAFSVSALTPTVTFRKFVEYPMGVFYPVLYGGATSTTMALAQPMRTSDPLTGLRMIRGSPWWEHTINMSGGSANFCSKEAPTTNDLIGVADCKYTAAAGGVPAHQAAGDASARSFGSVLITGTLHAADAKSVLTQGNSIDWGQGDVTGSGVLGSSGYVGRKLDLLGVPYVSFARMGMSAFDWVAMAAGGFTATFDAYLAAVNAAVTHVVNEYGVNDLRLSRTKAQLLADYQTIYGKFPGKGIVQSTLTPRSTGTPDWSAEANQAPQVDGNWSALTLTNTDIRAGLPNVSYVMETADSAMTARDSGIWKSSPTLAFVPTLDGTHPASLMAAKMAADTALSLR